MRRAPPPPNTRTRTPWTKRVIYLPHVVELRQLRQELDEYNPEYTQAAAAPPRILSGTVVLLHFLPGHIIPDEVEACGRMLKLQPYRPRGEQNANARRGQSRPVGTYRETGTYRQTGTYSRTGGRGRAEESAAKESGHHCPSVEEVEDEEW